MLILSRKVDESIHIGDDIIVTVVRISPDKVRLGFTCPKDMPIIREELGPYRRTETQEHGGEA